jgi:hypothetical protein
VNTQTLERPLATCFTKAEAPDRASASYTTMLLQCLLQHDGVHLQHDYKQAASESRQRHGLTRIQVPHAVGSLL